MIVMRDAKRPTGPGGREARRTVIAIGLGSLCLAAAFLVAALLLGSCTGSVSSLIGREGGARVSVQAELPAQVAARMRRLSSAGGAAPPAAFFDAAAIRKSLAERPGISLVELRQPSGDSLRMDLAVDSLERLAASPGLAGSGLMTLTKGSAGTELRLRFDHGSARALSRLLPGVDPLLMDALSPPALEEDPVTEAEYRTMLKSLLGTATMPALEAAAVTLSFTAPGTVTASGGGILSGSTLTARIPVIQALVLEKPIEIWLRWK